MATDRFVQLAAAAVACLLFFLGGRMLPGITASAGEPVVVIEAIDPDSDARTTVRIPITELRLLKTVTAAATPGAPLDFKFDAEGQSWSGALGDLVDVGWVSDSTRRDVRGQVVGTDGYGLRYTDVAVDGAPPIVALGTVMGAFRGLIVDYLWIKVNMMKEKGLFFEVMSDADLITKLQPRFGEVWGFHGHNMAYNISVLTNTPEERWEWVKEGIDLVRNRGLRYNPNDVVLHKELAFWFSHKLDGVADDAHLYYKREFAREWQYLLGDPPPNHKERVEWMKRIADAPETEEELYAKNPETRELVAQLTKDLSGFESRFQFRLDDRFLLAYGQWRAVKDSPYARILGVEEQLKRTDGDVGGRLQNRLFRAFDGAFGESLGGSGRQQAVDDFLAFLRRKVLRDRYNMDARLMWQYTRDTGPLDWRHPAAHTLYWAKRGGDMASLRYAMEDNISKVVNNDRTFIQSMQALARSGIMLFDPLANDNPTRLSDPRWIKVIDRYFRELHGKYFHVPGGITDSFTHFHENFMKQAVRELYRFGDLEGAKQVLGELDQLYGQFGVIPNTQYVGELEVLVKQFTEGEYEMQPDVARSDVYAALRRGFREGLLLGHPDVYKESIKFANEVTVYFKTSRYYDFTNKFGEGRMKELIGGLETSLRDVFRDVMMDTSTSLADRLIIYGRAGDSEKRLVYDQVKPYIQAEFQNSPLATRLNFEVVLPEPPGMEEHRAEQAAKAAREKAIEQRDRFETK
jgi:hypothetical protein